MFYFNWNKKLINESWYNQFQNKSPYQTSFSHFKRNSNRIKPKSIKINKTKQQKLSRKINRLK